MLRIASRLLLGGILGKCLGILREVLIALYYGTGLSAAAFRAAQAAVLIPINLLASESLTGTFVPTASRLWRTNQKDACALVWAVLLSMVLSAIILSGLLFFGAAIWVRALVPGFNEEVQSLTVSIIKVIVCGVPFYVLGTVLACIELSRGSGLTLASRTAALNSGIILGTVYSYYANDIHFVAWGFVIGCVMFCVIGVTRLERGVVVFHSVLVTAPWLARFIRAFLPLFPIPFFVQGMLTVERGVASSVSASAVAALDYARTIADTAMLFLATPVGLALLPSGERNLSDSGKNNIRVVVRGLTILTVPFSGFLYLHAEQIVSILYQRGAFDWDAVQETAAILEGTAIGLWAHVGGYVLLKFLNSTNRNNHVLWIMLAGVITSVAINLMLYEQLGPFVLGLSMTGYALVIFAWSAWTVGVLGEMVRLAAILGLGVGILVLLNRIVTDWTLGASVLVTVVFWVCVAMTVPTLRNDILGWMRRIKKT